MLRPLGNALASSVGRKIVVGITGLLLVAFLVEHLFGNLKLTPIPAVGDSQGVAFEEYVAFMNGLGPLKYAAEIGLLLLFGSHIYLALRLTLENREARKRGYVVRSDRGAKTFGSASMHVTGALLLVYLIKHLLDFRFDPEFHAGPAAAVHAKLSQPFDALIYVAASVLEAIHLSHGFRSGFQSIGISHPRLVPVLQIAGKVLAIALALGFAWIPVYYSFFHS
jgi:succinate dehydrogenase / fumarate reductase cytochrome b subunit